MSNTGNFYQNSIFWVEVDKIKPNPFQPRREFDEDALKALADSIKQYGVLQALVVTRKEFVKEDGGLRVEYELIAGERRLRASKIAGLSQVPVLIRMGEGEESKDDLMKLELAIIENVQREDLNPVERAKAFKKLADQFGFKHHQIAYKIGKSRVYVTNSMRILDLPEEILTALSEGRINEGHTRPLLMLIDRPEEQKVLFQDIMLRKMNVRDAEVAARRIAIERVRKINASIDPEICALEEKFAESLGTRVKIEKNERDAVGKLTIEFFSNDDLEDILRMLQDSKQQATNSGGEIDDRAPEEIKQDQNTPIADVIEEQAKEEEDLYSIKNFSI
jgi:ParB family transcriptional regulator, chromosome partitioning protein